MKHSQMFAIVLGLAAGWCLSPSVGKSQPEMELNTTYTFTLEARDERPVFVLYALTRGLAGSPACTHPLLILWSDGTCIWKSTMPDFLSPMSCRYGMPFTTEITTIHAGPYKSASIQPSSVIDFMEGLNSMGAFSDTGVPAFDRDAPPSIFMVAHGRVTRFTHVVYEELSPSSVMLEEGPRSLAEGETREEALANESLQYRRNRLVFDLVWGEAIDLLTTASQTQTVEHVEEEFRFMYSGLLPSAS